MALEGVEMYQRFYSGRTETNFCRSIYRFQPATVQSPEAESLYSEKRKQFDHFLNLEHSIRMKYDDMFFPDSYDKMFNFHQTCYPNEVNFKHD